MALKLLDRLISIFEEVLSTVPAIGHQLLSSDLTRHLVN